MRNSTLCNADIIRLSSFRLEITNRIEFAKVETANSTIRFFLRRGNVDLCVFFSPKYLKWTKLGNCNKRGGKIEEVGSSRDSRGGHAILIESKRAFPRTVRPVVALGTKLYIGTTNRPLSLSDIVVRWISILRWRFRPIDLILGWPRLSPISVYLFLPTLP